MNYPSLTIYNYKISYYFIRILSFFMLGQFGVKFLQFFERPKCLYHPTFFIQELIFPKFPSKIYYFSLIGLAVISLFISLIKPNVWINLVLFILMGVLNLPITAYNGAGHNNHLFVLTFFFSLFLLPKKLQAKDYQSVQFFYAGLLSSYSFAGLWKVVSILRDFATNNPRLSWIDVDAAKLNTLVNYHYADLLPPDFMVEVYEYKIFWIVATILAILLQTFAVIGAFNRKYLTFTMLYLVVFHLYNKYFVIADFTNAILVVLVVFFPYHLFRRKRSRKLN